MGRLARMQTLPLPLPIFRGSLQTEVTVIAPWPSANVRPFQTKTPCPEFSCTLLLTVWWSVYHLVCLSVGLAICLFLPIQNITQSFHHSTVVTLSLTKFCSTHYLSICPSSPFINKLVKLNVFHTVTEHLLKWRNVTQTFCPNAPVSTNVEKIGRGCCEFSGQHSMIAPWGRQNIGILSGNGNPS